MLNSKLKMSFDLVLTVSNLEFESSATTLELSRPELDLSRILVAHSWIESEERIELELSKLSIKSEERTELDLSKLWIESEERSELDLSKLWIESEERQLKGADAIRLTTWRNETNIKCDLIMRGGFLKRLVRNMVRELCRIRNEWSIGDLCWGSLNQNIILVSN